MSRAMTPSQMNSTFKKWGLNVRDLHNNWVDHNRNHKGDWGDMKGVMLHHTGPYTTVSGMLDLLKDGYGSLPGPLCNQGLGPGGILWNIGWGRANHAGRGDDEVLRNVITESYGKYPGYGEAKELNRDGNECFYGLEVIHSGYHQMKDSQYVDMILYSAAICDFHNWTHKSVIGHGEWQNGKWDPGYKSGHMMDMHAVRMDVKDALEAGPGNWPKKPEPKPEPETPVEEAGYYTIKRGDTLWSIAEAVLDNGADWLKLVAANQDVLLSVEPGDKIKIPD